MKTYWLASYPKSGNTWFRIFLSNLLFPDLAPVDPNHLPLNNLIASAKSPFYEIISAPSSLFTPDECDLLRPGIDELLAKQTVKPVCVRKAHDAYTYLPNGRPLMGTGAKFAAIYILRDPRDVAVSTASHWGMPLTRAVEFMCKDDAMLDNRRDRGTSQLRQRLLSWSKHAESWLCAPLDVCLIRYEQMHSYPLDTFKRATSFLGLSPTDTEIMNALEASRFDLLQKIEQDVGFREAPKDRRFFRAGKVNSSSGLLSADDVARLTRQAQHVELVIKNNAKTLA